jgi:hypothetical protein
VPTKKKIIKNKKVANIKKGKYVTFLRRRLKAIVNANISLPRKKNIAVIFGHTLDFQLKLYPYW